MSVSETTSIGRIERSTASLQVVKTVVERFPERIRRPLMTDLPRYAYEVDLVRKRFPSDSKICDIGAGWGVLALALAEVGMRATLLDDFGDAGFSLPDAVEVRKLWECAGLEVINRDPGTEGLGFEPSSFDVITTIDCIEHWHRSPKRMLHEAVAALKPGGLLIIGTPNSSNLRKRVSAVLGQTAWSALSDWYEKETFRGHVREPNVADLRYIGRDLGLQRIQVLGRNFAGWHPWRPLWIRVATPFVDHLLRLRPSFCSNLYLLGTKA